MQNKIRVFIIDGVVESVYSTYPNVEVEIVDFDKCKDISENLDVLYEECVPEMHRLEPTIIHPDW